ncbi:MAG: glycosyltransferase family 2 protein [Clostridiales bacterium]|nr:glycosyltransferase family 2 protein [Clostridiales bacterium]
MRLLVIIPAYNEQQSILKTVNNLTSTVLPDDLELDYLVINDGSTDNTLSILSENKLKYVNLPMNLGIGGAMQTGYLYARQNGYDIAVQLDGDGQHNPEYIEKLVRPLIDGQTDMTIGSRFIEKEGFQSTEMRKLGIKFLSASIKLFSGVRITDVTSGFRACNKHLIRFFSEHYAEDYPEPEAIISVMKNGYRIQEVPVMMNERQGGTSSISGFKAVYYMIKVELALVIQALRKKEKKTS